MQTGVYAFFIAFYLIFTLVLVILANIKRRHAKHSISRQKMKYPIRATVIIGIAPVIDIIYRLIMTDLSDIKTNLILILDILLIISVVSLLLRSIIGISLFGTTALISVAYLFIMLILYKQNKSIESITNLSALIFYGTSFVITDKILFSMPRKKKVYENVDNRVETHMH